MDQSEKSASETPTFGYRHLTNEEYIRQKRESNAAVASFLKETFPSQPYRRRKASYRMVADALVLSAIVMLFAAFFLLDNFSFPRVVCPVVDAVASTPFAFSHGCAESLVHGITVVYERAINEKDEEAVHKLYDLLTKPDDTSERNNILMNAAKFNHRLFPVILNITANSFLDIVTNKNYHNENLAHMVAQSGNVEHLQLLKGTVSSHERVPELLTALRGRQSESNALRFVASHRKMKAFSELLREKASCPSVSRTRSDASGDAVLQKACYIKLPSVREYSSTAKMAHAVNEALLSA